jgi:type I restriction enzyme S subunit
MRSEAWTEATLADLVRLQRGHDLPQPQRRIGRVPVLGSAGLSGFHDQARATAPGLVVGRSGASFGKVHYAAEDYWPLNTALFSTDFLGNDPRFVYYALLTLNFTGYNSGSAQPSLNRNFIAGVPVAIPPLFEQRRIAGVLGALDDKIDSNRRLAELLEDTAAALFKARFVDFVGVEEFEDSEIGPIPKGWRWERVSDAVHINPAVAIKRDQMTPFVEMAAVSSWSTRPDEIAARPYSGGCRFEPGDTLMAKITGCIEHGKGAFADFVNEPSAGSTEFHVFRARPPFTPEAVFFLSRSERLRDHAIANMTGSSGRQRVPASCFDNIRVAVPPSAEAVQAELDVMRSALAETRALWCESQTLTAIRDALLPKLISGQIRVPDTSDFGEALAL